MPTPVNRQTVDLSSYPNLVVIYLGMRVNRLTGLKTLLGFGPKIADSVAAKPDGLLQHENFVFSLFPPHVGTGFWHETYLMQGGMEAIYDDIPAPIGFMTFAPTQIARGPMFGAAHRAGKAHDVEPLVSEEDLYGG
jgi:hypothetical protein